MPARSLNSRVLRWPDADRVVGAAREWATTLAQARDDVVGIGYIGSYARGGWGVGSDLDIVIVIQAASEPFERRAGQFDARRLPVPVDLLVYTLPEWESLLNEPRRFSTILKTELRWLYRNSEPLAASDGCFSPDAH